jgi:protein-S-isoprenylcysteine O-methyltransferase Ste14
MYLGFVLLLLGTGLLLGDFAGVVVTMGFFMVVNRWYIPLEEARAEARFGAEYAAYRTRVRRWF